MSYDLKVFFPQSTFPRTEWRTILASFEGPECLVRFGANGDDDATDNACDLVIGESVLTTDIAPIEPGYWAVISKGARWKAVLSTTMGRSFRALWVQFAIPYHALVLIPGVTVHAEPDQLFLDPPSWLDFCRGRLWGPLRRKEDAVEHGLFTADGSPRF
jgi:hypothetical protein